MDTHIDLWFAASIVVISLLLSAFFAGRRPLHGGLAGPDARHPGTQSGDPRAAIVSRILAIRERFIERHADRLQHRGDRRLGHHQRAHRPVRQERRDLRDSEGMSVLVIVFAGTAEDAGDLEADKAALITARPVAFAVA
ncbi:hypothetical protein ACRAWF_10560 [Streptomyces sp. L7]